MNDLSKKSIERVGTTARWSDAVVYQGVASLCEVPDSGQGTIEEQTREVLSQIENRLIRLGTNKSRILSCTIYLTDRNYAAAFNEQWDVWVPQGCAPVRACVVAQLLNPDLKVEIQLTAAV